MLAAFAAALVLAPGLSLKKGDAWVAEQTWRWQDLAEEIDQTMVERVRFDVKDASGDAYTITTSTVLLKTRVEETDIPAPPNQVPALRTYKLDRRGALVDSPNELDVKIERIRRLIWTPHAPDATLKKWDALLPGDEPRGVPPLRSEIRLMEEGVMRSFSEGGQSRLKGQARVRLEPVTGFPMTISLQAQSAPMPGGALLASLSLEWKVVEWSLLRR